MQKIKDIMKQSPELANFLAFLVVGAILVIATNSLFAVFAPFIVSYMVTRMMYPVLTFLKTKAKIPRVFATIICMLLFILMASGIVWVVGHYLLEGISYLISLLSSQTTINRAIVLVQEIGFKIENLTKFAGFTVNVNDLTSVIGDVASKAVTALSNISIAIIAAIPNLLMALIIGCVAAFYMLYDYDRLADAINKQLSPKVKQFVDIFNTQVLSSFIRMIVAYVVVSCVCFIELTIGFAIIGIENSMFAALIIAILDVLPILGSGAVLVPWGIFCLLIGQPLIGIGLFVLWGVIIVVRQIVEPRVVGAQIGLHPLLTLASLYIGLQLMGGLGLIVGPLYVIACKRLNEAGVIHLYAQKEERKDEAKKEKKTILALFKKKEKIAVIEKKEDGTE